MEVRLGENTLPDRVYIYADRDTDGSFYLQAYKTLDEIPDDATIIGVYDRSNVGTLHTTRVLDFED